MTSVRVTTMELRTGRKSVKTIDHDNAEERQWLGKHCFWAMRSGYSVETRPVEPTTTQTERAVA